MDDISGSARPIQLAVIGAGAFGRNHVRVYAELAKAGTSQLNAIVDVSAEDAPRELAACHGATFHSDFAAFLADVQSGRLTVDAASVCVPTSQHFAVASALLSAGVDVLLEKPMASNVAEADALLGLAAEQKRVLQVGHLERFNPAITAVLPLVTRPMFFECHRLSVFTPRSLDVDVVLDLMIHDLDIVLVMAKSAVREVRAVGLPVLSRHADIANVRLEFESGCVANFTASRVSTERVRKLRLFQPGEYISVDYARQDALRIHVSQSEPAPSAAIGQPQLGFEKPDITPGEPLKLEIEAFLHAVRSRQQPVVHAHQSRDALALALEIHRAMASHGQRAGLAGTSSLEPASTALKGVAARSRPQARRDRTGHYRA